MQFITIMGVAIALAMDAFAVSIVVGMTLKDISARQIFRLSFHFGLFQALMPVIGWGLGLTIRAHIEAYDHWVAFALLALVGGNMFREALQNDHETEQPQKDATKGLTLVVLSVATSIDALAVGFGMSLLNISIIFPAIVIGLVAAVFTIIGMQFGKRVSSARLSVYTDALGGIVLWLIGVNILWDHGVFNRFF